MYDWLSTIMAACHVVPMTNQVSIFSHSWLQLLGVGWKDHWPNLYANQNSSKQFVLLFLSLHNYYQVLKWMCGLTDNKEQRWLVAVLVGGSSDVVVFDCRCVCSDRSVVIISTSWYSVPFEAIFGKHPCTLTTSQNAVTDLGLCQI